MELKDILTISEASQIWGVPLKTLRDRCNISKIFTNKDIRKSAGTWLITREAMERVYGKPKN